MLILLLALQIKHMFADYFMQTPRMLAGRATYLHVGRAQHAGVHVAGSAIALVLVGTAPALLVALLVAEWIAHFNIDWGKARYSESRGHTPDQAPFWRAAGFDQALHQFTYLAMVWAWVVFA